MEDMIIITVIAGIILILMLLYLWCLKPGKITKRRAEAIRPFTETYIAHRGLFDEKLMIPENSMAAFRRAVENGVGIELDVRLTGDNELVVFHDSTLTRMCGENKSVSQLDYEKLCQYRLSGTQQYIPKFEEVLKVIDARVPVIIEIKAENRGKLTAQLLNEQLKEYKGIYCIESFYPIPLEWYRKNRPEVIRGQLVSDFVNKKSGKKKNISRNILMNGLLLDVFSRPDFIAYNYKVAETAKYRIMRKLFRFTSAGWTIRSEEELIRVQDIFQIIIFDGFIPVREKV